jgi:hypothetical protein
MASQLIKAETVRTAEAIYDAIRERKEPVSAGDIAKEFNLGSGRHKDIASGLKHLLRQDKLVKLGDGRASRYITTEKHLKLAPITAEEIKESLLAPKTTKARAIPVHMVEIPKATLKLVVKAVMQCCTPMDNALLRATMQCMEKLI